MIELVGSRKEQIELINASKPVDTQYFYDKGFAEGAASVIDFGKYATGMTFNDLNIFETKEVVFNLDNATSLNQFIYMDTRNTTVEHVTINCKKPILDCYRLCYCTAGTASDNTLKRLTLNFDMSQTNNCNNMFNYLYALEVIDGNPIDFTNVPNNINTPFRYLNALKEVRFVPNSIQNNLNMAYSNLLSNETIESIIAGLATVETERTITLHADIKPKLTDEQKATIKAKNWQLA